MKVVRFSSPHTGRFYPKEILLILISVRVDPRAVLRPEGFSQSKIPKTSSGLVSAVGIARFWPLRSGKLKNCTDWLHHVFPYVTTREGG